MAKSTTKQTHYIHRTSYSFQERIVGVFVLTAIGILVGLLYLTIKNQNLFEEYILIYGKLSSAEGLSRETIVQISGIEVGKVSDVEITDKNDILLTMQIVKRYHRLLRTDSKIKVSSLNATIIGKSIIEITAGSHEQPILKEGSILKIQESSSVEDIIAEATATLETINKVVDDISLAVEAIKPEKIEQTMNAFTDLAVNLEKISAQIESGQGLVGAVLYDEQIKDDIKQSVANVNEATANLKSVIKTLDKDMDQVPVVLKNVNTVISETEQTIQATQRIWPLSTAMPKKEQSSKIVNPLPAND